VVNHVGTDKVFGQDTNSVVILARSGAEPQLAAGSKAEVSAAVIARVSQELAHVSPRA
jgi:phosphopantothenoylcysteine decarboxylase/phosphopantothenate--cysteine ligase